VSFGCHSERTEESRSGQEAYRGDNQGEIPRFARNDMIGALPWGKGGPPSRRTSPGGGPGERLVSLLG
jgi:hypothetical protein